MGKKSRKKNKQEQIVLGAKSEVSKIEKQQESLNQSTIGSFSQNAFAYSRWKEALGIILIIIVGFVVRLEDLRDWKANPNIAMYKGDPLLTTFDGYYYLTLARDIAEGNYTPIDYRRAVPDYPKRPMPPPLLSLTGAVVHKFTGISLNWVGAVLPAFLGMLLAIPLYLMARHYGGPIMALTGTIMGLLSHYYVYRSSVGWFDTDCMNVTWAVAAAYLFLKFGTENSLRRYIYCAGGGVVFLLFMLWWDQTPYVATVLSLLPFGVALVFFYRPKKREGLAFACVLGLLAMVVLAWKGIDYPVNVAQNVWSQYKYISKEASPDFPNLGITISEQARASFNELVAKTTDSKLAFFLSIVGLGLLFIKRPKESLFLSVPLVLAIFSFFFAKRFLIFVSPVTAMGIGYFLAFMWSVGNKFSPIRIVVPILAVVVAYFPFQKGLAKTFWPKEPPHLIDGMVYAGQHTPNDAVIWAWWDHGYPLIYFSNRGTVNDGSAHSPERSVYNGVPLAANNQKFAANFMRFYVARGLAGISKLYKATGDDKAKAQSLMFKVLAAGPKNGLGIINNVGLKEVGQYNSPEKWLEFFFPEKARPVYLYLDWRLTVTSYWWFWLGTWDISKHDGVHPVYRTFYNLKLKDNKIEGPGMLLHLDKGILKFNGKVVPLKQVIIVGKHKPFKKTYSREKGIDFEMFEPAGFGALMDFNIANSVFNMLYLRHTFDPRYFKPVRLMTPSHQIWEVRGDTL